MATEYFTTIDLSGDSQFLEPDHKQLVYASQLYLTHFEIFAIFETTVDGDNVTISKITFELFNYKGIVNIGFVDGTITKKQSNEFSDMPFDLEFSVRGFETLKTANTAPGFSMSLKKGDKIGLARECKALVQDPKWFDSECEYRDGAHIESILPKPGIMSFNYPKNDLDCPNPRCHHKILRIVFQ